MNNRYARSQGQQGLSNDIEKSKFSVQTETPCAPCDHVPQRTEYLLILTPKPGNWRTPPLLRLRALLKAALRGYGFRATVCRPVAPDPAPAAPAPRQAPSEGTR